MIFPEVDLSGDEGDPAWYTDGGSTPVYADDGSIRHYRWNRPPHVHRDWWDVIREEWARIAGEYESDPCFYTAYHYLDNHPVFWEFRPWNDRYPVSHASYLRSEFRIGAGVSFFVVRCDPEGAISKDPSLNTRTMIWYEFGKIELIPAGKKSTHWHDWKLDGRCGTYEEAVLEVARKVHDNYGNDRTIVDAPGWERE
jgi:hypothetical protein